MSIEVSIRKGESQESLLSRFQKVVQTSGILREVKSNRYFISRGERERIKVQQSIRRRRRQANSRPR
ncbi:MAG: 30S ribosomal protein S21 [Dehalococcoidales bacterium]|nr:30S ribosomal protein S21 [Dehalococcoidales bacterium]